MPKLTINKIKERKKATPLVCLTAYSKLTAQIADKHCDIILVGDSLGMVLYGMKNTREVKMETMILHAQTVRKFAKESIVVFDMPYKTYSNKIIAYKNARKVIKLTRCDAIKIEGGTEISNIIKYLTHKKIPVMGHIGLLPQTSLKFKVKGKSNFQKNKILKDADAVSKSGAFAIIIECVIESIVKKVNKKILVPTIGIGASKYCDGQILVTDDMLGLSDFNPKFVKKYSNLKKNIESSIKNYAKDVRLRKFPSNKNVYT